MMTFPEYLEEMRMKEVAPGVAIPAPSKLPAPKPRPPKPLVPAAKPKAPALEPLTLGQALEKSAQIAVLGKFARERLERGRARGATGAERWRESGARTPPAP
jgi:hypothetical protein